MKYTQYREDGRTIVVQGIKWVSVESFPITDDLKINGNGFVESLKSKEFYYYKNRDTTNPVKPVITTFHGPYLIEDITIKDYIIIDDTKAKELFNETLKDPLFLDEQILDLDFRFEASRLFNSALENCIKIYWLNKKFTFNDRFNSMYNYWAEFIVIGENDLKLISIGED
ncbi:hypothetical protein [Mangrovimonas xylaniphaga]|uniref:hypothetical protein n=1 Tax=Mangrovimonas xylaniphaga TaxID=1645915 RepID=UPI0006B60B57|nr:hypothetical protein [Mangrovimonas xylaniphaga]